MTKHAAKCGLHWRGGEKIHDFSSMDHFLQDRMLVDYHLEELFLKSSALRNSVQENGR